MELILESVIDPTRRDLDPKIFEKGEDNKYHMKDYIVRQVQTMIDEIDEKFIPVEKWLVKGSILSYQWLDWTDFDVFIFIEDMPNKEWDELREKVEEHFKDAKVAGTKHPIEFFLQRGEFEEGKADGIYDAVHDKWVKGPYDLTVNVEDYMEIFHNKAQAFDLAIGELERDVTDYLIMKSLRPEELSAISDQVEKKIRDINSDMDVIIAKKKEIKHLRLHAFDKKMSRGEIKTFGSKNRLPANVIQKLLERYNYMILGSVLKDIKKGAGGKVKTPEDVNKVRKAMGVPAPESTMYESTFRPL